MNNFLREKIRFINKKSSNGSCHSDSMEESLERLSDPSASLGMTNIKHGFILLFSLLISSVVLTAGLAVTRIMIRQIYLASVQRDSQMALFAADTGLECGRYINETLNPKNCNEQPLTDLNTDPNIEKYSFNLGKNKDTTCVVVTIDKVKIPNQITAAGYNVTCDANGKPTGGRVVERELAYIYNTP